MNIVDTKIYVFRPSERNTLRPRENLVVLLKSVFLSALEKWRMLEPFIAQGRVITISPEARQMALRWLKPYITARVLMARSS
jgi:hypothetical protein